MIHYLIDVAQYRKILWIFGILSYVSIQQTIKNHQVDALELPFYVNLEWLSCVILRERTFMSDKWLLRQ